MGGYEYVAGGICSALGPIVGDSVGGNSHTKMQWGPMHPTWDSGYVQKTLRFTNILFNLHDMKSVHGFWPDFLLKTSRFKGNALLVHPHKIRDINFTRITLYCFEHKGQKNILGTIQEIRKQVDIFSHGQFLKLSICSFHNPLMQGQPRAKYI